MNLLVDFYDTNKYTIKFTGCYRTAIDVTVRFRHKADVQYFEKWATGIELKLVNSLFIIILPGK